MMNAEIRLDVEMTLYIRAPQVANKFLEWFETQPTGEDASGWPLNFEHTQDTARLSTESCRVFSFGGMWEVALPKPGAYYKRPEDQIILHVYPNVPMQNLSEYLPEFLSKLGIDSFDTMPSWYIDRVAEAVTMLQGGLKE